MAWLRIWFLAPVFGGLAGLSFVGFWLSLISLIISVVGMGRGRVGRKVALKHFAIWFVTTVLSGISFKVSVRMLDSLLRDVEFRSAAYWACQALYWISLVIGGGRLLTVAPASIKASVRELGLASQRRPPSRRPSKLSKFVVRGASVLWLCRSVLALFAWFTEPTPALDRIHVIDIPIFPVLHIVSGIGALLLHPWGRRWLIITAGLTVALSATWPLMHGVILPASQWLNIVVALAFIGFFMLPSARRVFEERETTHNGDSPGAAASDQWEYGGSILSEIAGSSSVVLAIIAVLGVITLRWWIVIAGIFGSLITAFIGYRLAGGRANPGLVRSYWKDKDPINVAEDPIATWSAKVEGLFNLLEAQYPGEYVAALRRMNLQGLPATIQEAHVVALRNPTSETWSHLKTVMLKNRPPGHR